MPVSKPSAARMLEAAGYLLEAAVRFGLVSGSAVAAFFGHVLLAILFAALALGMFVRLWRGKLTK
jgi:hypothetical protein